MAKKKAQAQNASDGRGEDEPGPARAARRRHGAHPRAAQEYRAQPERFIRQAVLEKAVDVERHRMRLP